MNSDKKIIVGLVQIGDKFGDEYYLPYSIGLLQAYAQRNIKEPERYKFLLPIYRRVKVDDGVEYLLSADIVFFSVYIWNYQISLKIAMGIKQLRKDCIVVFGGPQVSESAIGMRMFLENNPFVDIGCYGQGEIAFLSILENFEEQLWGNVSSIGFLNKENSFVYNTASERISNLDEIPHVYSGGIFNSLINANPEQSWSALIETNRGCPFLCSYCYWGKKARNKLYQFGMERIFQEIDWFSQNKIQFVFCCDANFGIIDRDFEIVRKVSENKEKYGYPMAFSVQNTKNSTEKIFMLQKILNDNDLQKGVNIALQSLNKNTLKHVNRSNISMQTYKDLQSMFTQSRIPTFSDMIIALPEESYETFTKGVSTVIESGQHNKILFINLTVLRNTEMAEPEYQDKYGMKTVKSKMISHHTSLESTEEVFEEQDLVVETESMPKEDWVKTRVFCWMSSLLYFNKLLQIPFVIITKLSSLGYKELIEVFMETSGKYGKLSEILTFFIKKAEEIQKGGSEYVASEKWLNIWWPADEIMFIKVCREGIDVFYEEAEMAIKDFLLVKAISFPDKLLHDAILLNKSLLKEPSAETVLRIDLNHNVFEIYQGILRKTKVELETGCFNYTIDKTSDRWSSWDEWLREVVWYGSKKGAYLYECKN
tara:strand:- start:442 stop:2397 length:1956 start_codon:yes stop_codon:yes gene_type:complete